MTLPPRPKNQCSECKAEIEPSFDLCQDCHGELVGHEHDSSEGYMCLDCGHEGLEDAMSAAYDRAKDLRKYGE